MQTELQVRVRPSFRTDVLARCRELPISEGIGPVMPSDNPQVTSEDRSQAFTAPTIGKPTCHELCMVSRMALT